MTDRETFLEAISANPADDTVRLVYADWLDEHGAGDLDRATAEFIRLGCARRNLKANRMPPKAYPWLRAVDMNGEVVADNWRRLVPSVLGMHIPAVLRDERFGSLSLTVQAHRIGAAIRLVLRLPASPAHDPRPGDTCWYAMLLRFDRGFLKLATVYSHYAADWLIDAFVADQPLALIEWPEKNPTPIAKLAAAKSRAD